MGVGPGTSGVEIGIVEAAGVAAGDGVGAGCGAGPGIEITTRAATRARVTNPTYSRRRAITFTRRPPAARPGAPPEPASAVSWDRI
jgi:hypothetical protein